jgi:hypothetical protein
VPYGAYAYGPGEEYALRKHARLLGQLGAGGQVIGGTEEVVETCGVRAGFLARAAHQVAMWCSKLLDRGLAFPIGRGRNCS